MSTEIAPSRQYGQHVDTLARRYLEDQMGTQAAEEAAGRLSLAMRQAAASNPRIYECNPADVAVAVAMCARTGLMPGGVAPDVYMIPRGGQLQWQISSRGLRKLAEREGYRLRCRLVMEGDTFDAEYGLQETLTHRPDWEAEPTWEALRLAYVVAEPVGGGEPVFRIITKRQIAERRKAAQSDSIWRKWPLEMAEKTAIAYAVRRGIVPFDETARAVSGEAEATAAAIPAEVVEPAAQEAPQLESRTDALAAELIDEDNPAGLVDLDEPAGAAAEVEAIRVRSLRAHAAELERMHPDLMPQAREAAGVSVTTPLSRLTSRDTLTRYRDALQGLVASAGEE